MNSPLVPVFRAAANAFQETGSEQLLMKRWTGASLSVEESIEKTTLTSGQESTTYKLQLQISCQCQNIET